jgi:hypothetical protein
MIGQTVSLYRIVAPISLFLFHFLANYFGVPRF